MSTCLFAKKLHMSMVSNVYEHQPRVASIIEGERNRNKKKYSREIIFIDLYYESGTQNDLVSLALLESNKLHFPIFWILSCGVTKGMKPLYLTCNIHSFSVCHVSNA